MYQTIAAAFQLMLWPIPWSIRRFLLGRAFGYEISSKSRIGFSIILARSVKLAPESRIGHLTLIRNVDLIDLGQGATIGNFNKIAGVPSSDEGAFSSESERSPSLIMGPQSALTNSHIIDCTNRVTLGAFATVAGWRCQILTHSIDLSLSRQRSAPVSIGSYSFVGTGCILLRGAILPDRTALAAGSVLASAETESFWVYSGVPAVKTKPLKPELLYFSRNLGRVE